MKNANLRVMHSSEKDDWETPPEFFAAMEKLFGKFALDVCANEVNHKCIGFLAGYGHDDDGLQVPWHQCYGGNPQCWMNPPYGRNVTGKWVAKAIEESKKGAPVICLLPARTDTKWFRACYENAAAIYFVQGRLKFVGAKDSAPFPSMVVVFNENVAAGLPRFAGNRMPVIKMMSTKGEVL
jgi:phage N-6-adenine-methyltransferase